MGNCTSRIEPTPTEETFASASNSQHSITDNSIHRLAINQSAIIGSLYDAIKDRLLKAPALDIPAMSVTPRRTANYPVIDTGLLQGQNLPDIIRIDKELRLSIYLNTITSEGISLLIKYPYVINKHTRYLSYYYPTEQTSVHDKQNVVQRKVIPESIYTTTATHVVTSILSGIHVVVILQTSPKYESDLDRLLEKIKEQLITKTFRIEPDEEDLFNQFTDINVFSNVPDIAQLRKLTDVCHKITEMIPDVTQHRALEYTLQPIRSLFPSYPTDKGIYYPLEQEEIDQIEAYLYQLLLARKLLKIPIDPERKKLAEKYLKTQYDKIQQQMLKMEELYQDKIKRDSILLPKIRSGQMKQNELNELLIDDQSRVLLEEARDLEHRFSAMKGKARLIDDLKKTRIQYWNVKELVQDRDHDLEKIKKQLVKKSNGMRIFCFDDKLENPSSSEWNKCFKKMNDEHRNNPQLEFVYADFSYCSCQLVEMEMLSPKDNTIHHKVTFEKQLPTATLPSLKATPPSSKPAPVLSKVTPSTSQSTRLSSKPAPVVVKVTPSTSQSTRLSSKPAPIVVKPASPAPKPKRAAAVVKTVPAVSKPKPAVGKPTPTALTSKAPASKPASLAPKSQKPIDRTDPPTISFINVLLLGESGVGKSTFINAIVNYLKFENLEQARSGEPIVLMPISFLMTVGDNFQEKIVIFGGEDPHEDHKHPGQSVTQYCRSYVFTIGTRTKIRLIDTPGMGDTRGLDQDDRNMQHILSYINNLSHLNAICILLKPNEARLNVVLRSYFNRLLGFLGENVRHNIVFCFTNTRTTFYTPGNTGPLLKKMLESHTIKDIPYRKINTFCFDNESFRYLIARLNGIEFDDYQKEEYKHSWINSVNESNRLLGYICSELKPYPRKDWQSIEHAHFQITELIWPMLETIRNTMRNAILLENNLFKSLIKLRPKPVSGNANVCLDCKSPELLDKFWIVPDELHILSNRCDSCQCDLLRHAKINYLLTYETWIDKQKPTPTEIKANLNQLKQMITDFIYIFKDVIHISKKNHPILSALNQMIDEEKDIFSKKGRNILNSNLHDELEKLKNQCEKLSTAPASNRKPMALLDIYKIIQKVSKTDIIREQMDAIKETQKIYMAEQEIYV